ncbi:uncharacterized protein LOC109856537 [Pseudomyrmex gracilis]|uniref:uncharacterized protein LOC109856537 n=1 Tax=Pseudomyrmex gracilis TaxID=219809 RepID=UPI000995736E|nr:uncharacterized protein LOC109856537 [Pseudomyrmex gracilis]
MFRSVFRKTHMSRFIRYFNRRAKHDSKKDETALGDVAYETEYYYKQDKKMLKDIKEKTQDEVKQMQREIQIMRNKIEEYNRGISENLRFLKGLERDLSAGDKKN